MTGEELEHLDGRPGPKPTAAISWYETLARRIICGSHSWYIALVSVEKLRITFCEFAVARSACKFVLCQVLRFVLDSSANSAVFDFKHYLVVLSAFKILNSKICSCLLINNTYVRFLNYELEGLQIYSTGLGWV